MMQTVFVVFQRTQTIGKNEIPHDSIDIFDTFEGARNYVDETTDSNRRLENTIAFRVHNKFDNPEMVINIEGLYVCRANEEVMYETELESEFPVRRSSRCKTVRAVIRKEVIFE